MYDPDPPFRPIRRRDGYLPLEDYGLIGDGATAALAGVDGTIPWLCIPRFDAEPLFCGLLDHACGGSFTVAPANVLEGRQRYQPDTGVLETEMRCATGVVRLTDAMAVRSGADLRDDAPANRAELVRSAIVVDGHVRVNVDVAPRGGGEVRPVFSGLEIRAKSQPGLRLHLRGNRPLTGLHSTYDLEQGERLDLVLSWGRFHRHHRFDASSMLHDTASAWRFWLTGCSYDGPREPLVRRAAITLKLCDHWVNGSVVAAPTSSLPAPIGGVRNWDYRYVWIRDASYAVYALRRIGFHGEADAFLGWVLDAFERSDGLRIMYDIDGDPVPDETEAADLEGYRRSAPVRWGNGAADQRQHDLYARFSTAPTSGCARAGRFSQTCGRAWLAWRMRPVDHGRNRIKAFGKYAAMAARSPTVPHSARSRWTEPPRSANASGCPVPSAPGGPPPRTSANPS
ncbi:Glycosyl hydrolases family 15 [Nocardia amikacinitolerans]|nr:Glycosyl hydrolases family 15 [Nocardia amikacinitolerans]